jgi:hypothetical protein
MVLSQLNSLGVDINPGLTLIAYQTMGEFPHRMTHTASLTELTLSLAEK